MFWPRQGGSDMTPFRISKKFRNLLIFSSRIPSSDHFFPKPNPRNFLRPLNHVELSSQKVTTEKVLRKKIKRLRFFFLIRSGVISLPPCRGHNLLILKKHPEKSIDFFGVFVNMTLDRIFKI